MTPLSKATILAATTALLAGAAFTSAHAQSGDFRACLQGINAEAVRQGKTSFMETPVAVDGPGARRVLAAAA